MNRAKLVKCVQVSAYQGSDGMTFVNEREAIAHELRLLIKRIGGLADEDREELADWLVENAIALLEPAP